MNVDQKQEFETLLEALSTCLDKITTKLRTYDAALRMVEANNPSQAENFKFWMAQSERLPELTASREYDAILQQLRELFVRVVQASNNPTTTETSPSQQKQLPRKDSSL
jgi:hypothetical protein